MTDKEKQILEIKDAIDSVYCGDCAYYGVDGFAIAEELYSRGYRKQSGWVSVDEMLPETYEDVLCFDRRSVIIDFICSDGTWCGIHDKPITHWMPLPEPPKMKGGA